VSFDRVNKIVPVRNGVLGFTTTVPQKARLAGETKPELSPCFWGIYCSFAISTNALGVYHCPFDSACFKRYEGAN
jgi:hypothetical protein